MGGLLESPEIWLAVALLIATWAAITWAAFSRKPDAHMEFLCRLIENIPGDTPLAAHTDEANPVQPNQVT